MTSLTVRTPDYLPEGYRSWTTVLGRDAGGFGATSDDQYSMTFARGSMPEEKANTLLVYRGPANSGELLGTQRHAGESVDIGVSGVQATYHDGVWAAGPGPEEPPCWTTHGDPLGSVNPSFPHRENAERGRRRPRS
jgi:hypothetical protein